LFLLFAYFFNLSISKAQIGLTAGINFSNIVGHNVGNEKLNLKINTGFQAGVVYGIPLLADFVIQPALLLTSKGSRETGTPGPDNYIFTKTGYYLELPINLIYQPVLGKGHLLFGAEPYLGYGLEGVWKNESTANTKGTLVFVNDFNQYDNAGGKNLVYGKKIDYGANLLAGYKFSNKVSVQLNSQFGLMDITPLKDGEKLDVKQNNIQFGLSVGYSF
jgi:hypothetical protein